MTSSGELPAVSVVVCTMDRFELLRAAVASVWSQDYEGQIDVVVVVDGTVPSELELPTPPENRTLQVIGNQRRPGLAGARNTGTQVGANDLVAFLDDDDLWRPAKVSLQVATLLAHPGAGLVGGGICVDNGRSRVDRVWRGQKVTLGDLLDDRVMELHPSTFLMRRSTLASVGGVDEQMPGAYGEDYDLLIRLARKGEIWLVPQVVADIRWQGQSYFFSRWSTIADALQYLVDKHPEFQSAPGGLARIEGQIAFALAASRRRGDALRWARRAFGHRRAEPRLYLAVLVASGLVQAETVQRTLHRRGRGI